MSTALLAIATTWPRNSTPGFIDEVVNPPPHQDPIARWIVVAAMLLLDVVVVACLWRFVREAGERIGRAASEAEIATYYAGANRATTMMLPDGFLIVDRRGTEHYLSIGVLFENKSPVPIVLAVDSLDFRSSQAELTIPLIPNGRAPMPMDPGGGQLITATRSLTELETRTLMAHLPTLAPRGQPQRRYVAGQVTALCRFGHRASDLTANQSISLNAVLLVSGVA